MERFKDKTVIITGGAGAIGKATAKAFLEEGARVALVDLDESDLKAAADDLGAGERVAKIAADVSKEGDVESYVKKTREVFGQIDIFFNNAGIEGDVAPIIDQEVSNFDAVLGVNARGVFLGLKHVMRAMKDAQGGVIVNMSSVAGLQGSPGLAPYIASKHAVAGLTKTAALEGAKMGIRVNSVHPAPVDTRMMRSIESGVNPDDAEAVKEQFLQTIPMRRYGEPEDIAGVVLFLASDAAGYVTGAQYVIDGGLTAG